jgi:hypothetical protein
VKHKYRNVPTVINGIRFPSKGEGRRYGELLLLLGAGAIRDLRRQVTFPLYGKNGSPICSYRADFLYEENGKLVCEDFKGFETPEFKIKAKLFRDNYGREIELRVVT